MGIKDGMLGLLLGAGILLPVWADEVHRERAEFAAGATDATIEGSVTGYDSVEYLVDAGAGQEMTVTLTADNPQTYFNVFAPGDVPGESTALYNGPRDGLDYRGLLTKTGDYTVQVFLMRAAARRAEDAAFTVKVGVTGAAAPAAAEPAPDPADGLLGGPDLWQVTGLSAEDKLELRAEPSAGAPFLGQLAAEAVLRNLGCRIAGGQRWCEVEAQDDPSLRGWLAGRYLREAGTAVPVEREDALVPGTDFNATGDVPCATVAGQPTAPCAFGVQRQGGGAATVTVTLPDGGARVIRFEAGQAIGSDGTGAFGASRDADLNKVSVGDERYEIPDLVVWGD